MQVQSYSFRYNLALFVSNTIHMNIRVMYLGSLSNVSALDDFLIGIIVVNKLVSC